MPQVEPNDCTAMISQVRTVVVGSLTGLVLAACGGDGSGTGQPGATLGGQPSAGTSGLAGSLSTGGSGAGATSGATSGGNNAGGNNAGGNNAGGNNAGGNNAGGGNAGGVGGASTGGTGGASAGGAGPNPTGVERWHPIDIVLGGSSASQVKDSLSATFKGPGGETLKVPGFFDGAAGWKVRFAPTAPGAWSYVTTSSIAALEGKQGSVQCVANANPLVHGKVMVDAAHPHYFKYEDGTPYVMMGFEADWLGLMDFGNATIPNAKSLIDMYTSRGFNQVLMNVFAYDTSWESGKTSNADFGPPAEFAWQGSNSNPDFTQMNPSFFASYDNVMQYLFEHGVVAHVMIKVYNKQVKWPAKGSAEDDLYFKYVLARYQAYPNLVWDFSKESNNESDVAYKSGRIKLIHAQDAYQHPVSTHTDEGYYANAASHGLLNFRTDQNQNNWYSTIIAHRNADAWPVINSEYDYEIGNDGGRTYNNASDKLTCLKEACEVTLAGGHFAYYYTYHAWDVVRVNEVPNGLGYYKNLYAVISATKWSELSPADDLIDSAGEGRHCLAKPGSEYLVYLAKAGTASLKIAQAAANVKGQWMNLVTGQQQAISAVGNGQAALTNPWSDPALAHLAP